MCRLRQLRRRRRRRVVVIAIVCCLFCCSLSFAKRQRIHNMAHTHPHTNTHIYPTHTHIHPRHTHMHTCKTHLCSFVACILFVRISSATVKEAENPLSYFSLARKLSEKPFKDSPTPLLSFPPQAWITSCRLLCLC